jgi:CDP-diacylglycerol--serine O-phosphatidyltransferase
MKKIYLLPNVITAFGLSCGLYVIFKLSVTPAQEVTPEVLTLTAGILLLAALADLLDGALARIMKAESEFGGFFDSMADAITFGVAPSVIVLKSVPANDHSFLLMAGSLLFSVCGVLRLVRYSVSAQLAKSDLALKEADKKHFTGLPIPAGAAALISMNLFLLSSERAWLFSLPESKRPIILFLSMVVIGYFMISRWKFPSLKTLHIKVASFEVLFLTILASLLIIYGIQTHFALIFFAASWAYIVAAWILSIMRVIAGRKSKTLEEFEPDDED